jgi:hypothetical protein
MCVVVAVVGVLIAVPIPLTESKNLAYLLTWCLLFSGAFLVPTLTGIMLNSIQQSYKTTANSIATLGYNLFGFLPAPVIYGYVSILGKNPVVASRFALACIMYWSVFILIMIFLAYS